jgi:hypothetical protein
LLRQASSGSFQRRIGGLAGRRLFSKGESHTSMYCEITVEHRQQIRVADLSRMMESFENPIELSSAYNRSEFYRGSPPASSICAFESGPNCFVILRKVTDIRFSIYHLEGNGPRVTVPTMLEAVQAFAGELMAQLHLKTVASAYKPRSLTVKLFEDNGKETGLVGTQTNIWSVFKEKFALKEIVPSLVTFVTATLLLWRGLDNKPLLAAIYSLAVVVFFKLVETLVAHLSKRGKIEWKLSGS